MSWLDVPALLTYATPVGLAAIGETVNQKSGVLNIGLEGTMLAGAYFGMLGCLSSGSPYVGLGVGLGVGALISAIQSLFVLKLRADQVVVGTAINLFALGVTGTLFRAKYGASGQLLSLPRLGHPIFGLDLVVVVALLLAFATHFGLTRTRWGLALRAAGEYPEALRAAGFAPLWLRFQGLMIGGCLAGLAGSYLSVGVAASFAENMTAGRGFVAIAMVTFGRWRPIWVFAASLLVGYAESLQYVFQSKGTSVPYQFFVAMPYIIALLVLVIVGRGQAAPTALGKPYRP